MAQSEPPFSIGIEEEYLLVDIDSCDLTEAPPALMAACAAELEGQVSPEFLQCQIEIGTRVCANIGEAREDLRRLRSCVARIAGNYGLAPIAVSCHPFADWKDQPHTDKDRYNTLARDLGGVVERMLICGMHVHVGIDDDDLRADLLNQFSYFLPHLLAISTSSPFWEGRETGLRSYRLTVFDNLPRTGIPPHFSSFGEYERSVQTIINSGTIQDATKIWWDLRPSARFPTLESRICDVSPRLNDTIAIAALTQCLFRMLFCLRRGNQRWREYDRFLIEENRWRAQRYGMSEGLIDFGRGEVVSFGELMHELVELLMPHAKALNCVDEVAGSVSFLQSGTSADRQVEVYQHALKSGADESEALKQVVRSLVVEFKQDL